MNASRLRLIVILVWMLVFVLVGALIIWVMIGDNFESLFPVSQNENPALVLPTITAGPLVILRQLTPTLRVPTFTLIPSTSTPLPPSVTPITPLPSINYYQQKVPPNVDPITGLQVADPSLLDRRPVAVKITNFPRGVRNYQYGLSRADVVYEYYIEDDLTRFIAVFLGQNADKAGPVRSGRYFDEHIIRMYRAALVFVSADLRVRNYFINSPDLLPLLFLPRDDNCPPLCRDKTIQDYNNYFVNTAGVGPMLSDDSRQDLRATFTYGLLPNWSGSPITKIFTHYSPYSYNYWEYDPTRHLYLRYSDAVDALDGQTEVYTPLIDRLTNQQVTANNVVELVVPHTFNNDFDRADQVYNITLTGSGDAYVFHQGRVIKGRWVRDRIDQPILLVDQSGNPVALDPGVTFYQVIDPQSTITQEGTTMEFFFAILPRYFTPTPTATRFRPTPTQRTHQ